MRFLKNEDLEAAFHTGSVTVGIQSSSGNKKADQEDTE
jgi:hypothetical protein